MGVVVSLVGAAAVAEGVVVLVVSRFGTLKRGEQRMAMAVGSLHKSVREVRVDSNSDEAAATEGVGLEVRLEVPK